MTPYHLQITTPDSCQGSAETSSGSTHTLSSDFFSHFLSVDSCFHIGTLVSLHIHFTFTNSYFFMNLFNDKILAVWVFLNVMFILKKFSLKIGDFPSVDKFPLLSLKKREP